MTDSKNGWIENCAAVLELISLPTCTNFIQHKEKQKTNKQTNKQKQKQQQQQQQQNGTKSQSLILETALHPKLTEFMTHFRKSKLSGKLIRNIYITHFDQ